MREGAGAAALGLALPVGELAATRVPDANAAERSNAVVRSVAFHPTAPLLLTAGMDKSIRLFQIDGSRNPKVQGVFLEDMPIYRAAFSGTGEHVIAAGRAPGKTHSLALRRRPSPLRRDNLTSKETRETSNTHALRRRRRHFYVYHLGAGRVERVAGIVGCPDKSLESFVESPVGARHARAAAPAPPIPLGTAPSPSCGSKRHPLSFSAWKPPPRGAGASPPLLAFLGNEGSVPLVSLQSRSCVAQLRMSGTARAAAFADGGRTLLTAGGDGQVYTWDLRTHRCLERMADDGALSAQPDRPTASPRETALLPAPTPALPPAPLPALTARRADAARPHRNEPPQPPQTSGRWRCLPRATTWRPAATRAS